MGVWAAKKGYFPTPFFGFEWDSNTGLYHTTFDCWQGSMFDGALGYNRLYDGVFYIGTSMDAVRFDFTSGGKSYTIWAWKGDYLNLGAGCELGVYERAGGIAGALGHFLVDPTLALDMSLTLTYKGNEVGSYNGWHWWPSSFNPAVQGVNASDLTATFSLKFRNREKLYQDFKSRWVEDSRWSFDDSTNTATLTF